MYFNENKYRRCIKHLVTLKTLTFLLCFTIFAIIGAEIGILIMNNFFEGKLYIVTMSAIIGAIFGLIFGSSASWEVETKIQEAYWKIDILKELKQQTSLANKNTPIAKTIVAIENKSGSEQK